MPGEADGISGTAGVRRPALPAQAAAGRGREGRAVTAAPAPHRVRRSGRGWVSWLVAGVLLACAAGIGFGAALLLGP